MPSSSSASRLTRRDSTSYVMHACQISSITHCGRYSPASVHRESIRAGFGVFTANAIVRSTSKDEGLYSTWRVSRSGYLSAQLAGYALARYAQARGETKPAWRKHLSADPRAYFEQSRRFLRREPPLSLLP